MEPEKIQFSHYRALKLIGKGGIGEVYLAEDAQAQRQVAAKIISIETLKVEREANVNMLRQFLREVATCAKLDHPNILPLSDQGEATLDKSPIVYVIMPYRPEGSLITWLSQHAQKQPNWRPTPRQVIHIVRQTGAALQHAHDHQITHLDVKPTNLLIHNRSTIDEYPDLLLSDFGSAFLYNTTGGVGQSTRAASAYIAPEQLSNKPVPASDQYALGALAYELLTGNPPFQGERQDGTGASAQERLKPVSAFIPQLPPDVDLVLQRVLAHKPEERFPSVTAFTQAFQTALQNVPATAQNGEARPPSNSLAPTQQPPASSPSNGDIRTTLIISTQEARDGAVRMVNLPNGQKVEIQIPAGARDEQVLTLNGKGDVPAPGAPAGNLYLRLSLPKSSSLTPPTRNAAATPIPNGAPAQPPTPFTPPAVTPRPNMQLGTAMPAPISPSPMATPSVPPTPAPLPSLPVTPRPNMQQGPASVAPMPPSPMATPRPNMQQGPASVAPMPPARSNMQQGPASVAPMPPARSNMQQGPASVAPMPPARDAFARQKSDMPPPTATPLRRANSSAAVIVMIVLLLIALGVSGFGALTSNWALLQDLLYGTPAPTVSSTSNQVIPTATSKTTTSSVWHTKASGTSQELVSVAWADTHFVTVGSNGTILTSPDGNAWTAHHSGTTQDLTSVVWSGSLLTAVGSGGAILTSPDGNTWTVQHAGTTQDLWSVGWVDGSIFVVAGSNGTILTSKDGHTWATQHSSAGQILDGVAWSNTTLAIVGTNGLILTSTDDGTTWTIQNSGTQQLLESVTWVNNQFVAVGTNGTILTSAKGTVWTAQNSNVTQNLSAVGWSGSQFVVVGNNGIILTSSKGTVWAVQSSGTSQQLSGIARSTITFLGDGLTPIPTSPIFIAVGNHGTILTGP